MVEWLRGRLFVVWERFSNRHWIRGWSRVPRGSLYRSTPFIPDTHQRASSGQDLNHGGLKQSIPEWPLGVRHRPSGSDHYFLIKRLMQTKSSLSPLSNGFLTERHAKCTFAVTRSQLSVSANPSPPTPLHSEDGRNTFHKHLILFFASAWDEKIWMWKPTSYSYHISMLTTSYKLDITKNISRRWTPWFTQVKAILGINAQ